MGPCLAESSYKSMHAKKVNLVSKQKGLYCTIPERDADGNFLHPLEHIRRARLLRFESDQKACLPHVKEAAMASARFTVEEHKAFRRQQIRKWWKHCKQLRRSGRKHNPDHAFYVEVVQKIDEELDLLNRGPDRFRDPLNVCKMVLEGGKFHGKLGDEQLFEPSPDRVNVEPELTVEQLLRRQPQHLGEIKNRLRRAAEPDRQEVWRATMKDVEKGHARIVATGSQCEAFDASKSVFYARFLQKQLKNDKNGWIYKNRPCDDGAANSVNRVSSIFTPITVNTVDRVAALVQGFMAESIKNQYQGEFMSFCLDHIEAYRQVLGSNRAFRRIVVVLNERNELVFVEMLKLMFGEAASVLHYNCVARILTIIVCRVLLVPIDHYYDDLYGVAKSEDPTVILDVLIFLAVILRSRFNNEKLQYGKKVLYCGVEITLSREEICFQLSWNRIQKCIWYIEHHLSTNKMSPADASSLYGKLGWSSCSLFGRVGRAMLNPIGTRRDAKQPAWYIGNNLRECLRWWKKLLLDMQEGNNRGQSVRRRIVVMRDSRDRPIIVYTDACEFALGAVVLWPDGTVYYFSVPVEDPENIALLECEAACLVHHIFSQWFADQEILQFCDNNIACAIIVNGSGHVDGINEYVHALWSCLARGRAFVWFERVCSDSNIGDWPSRLKSVLEFFPNQVVYEVRGVTRLRDFVPNATTFHLVQRPRY